MKKYKYSSTQEIYEYIVKNYEIGEILETHHLVDFFSKKFESQFTRKALSDLNKDSVIARLEMGKYAVLKNMEEINLEELANNLAKEIGFNIKPKIKRNPVHLSSIRKLSKQFAFEENILFIEYGRHNSRFQEILKKYMRKCLKDRRENIISVIDVNSVNDISKLLDLYFSSLDSGVLTDKTIYEFNREYEDYFHITNNINMISSEGMRKLNIKKTMYGISSSITFESMDKNYFILY